MEQVIKKYMESPAVLQAVKRLNLRRDAIYDIYYNSGIEYLECLRSKMKRKRVFDRVFNKILSNQEFAKMTPSEVITTIRNSSEFWDWWITQLWCVCKQPTSFNDSTELFYRLQFTSALIPYFILKQIFNGKQNTQGREGTGATHQTTASISDIEKMSVGKRVKNRV